MDDFRQLKGTFECPKCGSYNTMVVEENDDVYVVYCHDCDYEWNEPK